MGCIERRSAINIIVIKDIYKEIIKSIKKRLFTNISRNKSKVKHSKKAFKLYLDISEIIYKKDWDKKNFFESVDKIKKFSRLVGLDEDITCYEFHEYKSIGIIGENIQKIRSRIDVLAVSTAECERGFSQMNLIMTDKRNKLGLDLLKTLLTIRIVGPPVDSFKPEKYVREWFKTHNSADTHSTKKKKEHDEYYGHIHNIL